MPSAAGSPWPHEPVLCSRGHADTASEAKTQRSLGAFAAHPIAPPNELQTMHIVLE